MDLIIKKSQFADGGALALLAFSKDAENKEEYIALTVNLPENVIPLGDRRTFFNVNGMNNPYHELLEVWVNQGLVDIIGQMRSGFVTYPMIELSDEFYNSLTEL